jgi:hypothetical protein
MNETPNPKSRWRIVRRILIALTIFATLVAIFYTEEDWRGKRAWENCKRELEAKGFVMDWSAYIPPPVPDDQNFFKASKKIAFSFIHSTNDAQAEFFAKQERYQFGPIGTNAFPIFDNTKAKPLVVARLTILTPDFKRESANTNLIFKLNDSAASDQIGKLIQKTTGQSANGSQGFKFSEMQLSNLVPAQIFVQADSAPSIRDLENFIPPDAATNIGHLRIEQTIERGVFQVVLTGVHITAAADYLKWSGQYEPDFNEIREALKRPYAQIDGDYSQPYSMAVPNFVTMRALAQTLAQRTQCYLLLGEPEKALRELTLIKDSCHVLTGKPMTLVSAMINVAISGLYVQTVADGMRLRAWQEPQLAAIQEQLNEINLPPIVTDAFKMDQVSSSQVLATLPAGKIADLFSVVGYSAGKNKTGVFWSRLKNPKYLFFEFMPRGWIFQNMVTDARLLQNEIDSVDVADELVSPRALNGVMREFETTFRHISPYNFIAAIWIPNFTKAWQTTAHTQTLVNEAQIACALERYRLAHGEYPGTLDALAPQFFGKIPHDIIGGEPLHYRRTDDGKFLLYSVGWNETDDGGLSGTLSDVKKGDWVWKN